jgi:hypothetical protein
VTAEPVIRSAVVGPGHDGHAEVVVELLHPNGGRTRLSVPHAVAARALDAAGARSIDELAGRPWTVLVPDPVVVPVPDPVIDPVIGPGGSPCSTS